MGVAVDSDVFTLNEPVIFLSKFNLSGQFLQPNFMDGEIFIL